jgi:hypothetical protein
MRWLAVLLLGFGVAHAQVTDRAETQTPSSDLYLRRRPAVPGARVPKDLEPILQKKEKLAAAKRVAAIRMLEELLRESPTGVAAEEALFKLSELYWEESGRQFVLSMARYEQQLEACRQRTEGCQGPPRTPRLDLSRAEQLYKRSPPARAGDPTRPTSGSSGSSRSTPTRRSPPTPG